MKNKKRKCIECGKEYIKTTSSAVCSSKCQYQRYYEPKNPWVGRKCSVCPDTFKVRKKNVHQRACSKPKCRLKSKKPLKDVYNKKVRDERSDKLHLKENDFSEQKYKYADKIIDYPSSLTGRAYIGLSKQPLMQNKNGIGFQGVLLQSENRELIQCYECGEWHKHLSAHLQLAHKIKARNYKIKYGLNLTMGLVSDAHGNFLSAKAVDVLPKMRAKALSKDELEFRRARGCRKATKRGIMKRVHRQKENLWGTCPAQLKQEVVDFVKRFHKLPNVGGRGGFSKYTTLKTKFGSINNAFKEFGLPIRHKHSNSLVEYVFEDKTNFFLKQGKGYEELYLIMKNKCPVLQD